MDDAKSIAQMLLDSAWRDAAACKLLADAAGIGDAIVGFHAQQAAEKSIKAVLSHNRIEFRRTHDLLALLDLIQDSGLPLPPGSDWVDELNPYAVEACYGTIDPEGLDKSRAIAVVDQFIAWAAARLT